MVNQFERLGPADAASVVWVGHSLIQTQVETAQGPVDLMSLVGAFAAHRGVRYTHLDHTLWGSPLSALWRGAPHGYERDASDMVARREAFERDAQNYDTMVLTEVLPLTAKVMRLEASSYYLRLFYCALKKANPAARVYLYQTWAHFQGTGPNAVDPPAHRYDWLQEMNSQRRNWHRLADTACRPGVAMPGWLSRFGLSRRSNAGCDIADPIYAVPVGDTFIAIAERLNNPHPADDFALPAGTNLALADFFTNPYIDWPDGWPVSGADTDIDPATALAALPLRDPDQPHDDVHLSATGIYVAALVHFATLYRQSPVGLPAPPDIGDAVGHTLQSIVWQTVLAEPRAGVATGNSDGA